MIGAFAVVQLHFDSGLNPTWAHVYVEDGNGTITSTNVPVGAFDESHEAIDRCTMQVAQSYVDLGVWS
jgi:hypothetical protein